MARLKRKSADLERAQARATALRSISPTLDLGNGQTLAAYDAGIAELDQKLSDYNAHLSLGDAKLNVVESLEKALNDTSERMLAGVAAKFGKNSNEYEQAGGKRKSEVKRATKKATKAAGK